jgi:hypothetical protein
MVKKQQKMLLVKALILLILSQLQVKIKISISAKLFKNKVAFATCMMSKQMMATFSKCLELELKKLLRWGKARVLPFFCNMVYSHPQTHGLIIMPNLLLHLYLLEQDMMSGLEITEETSIQDAMKISIQTKILRSFLISASKILENMISLLKSKK